MGDNKLVRQGGDRCCSGAIPALILLQILEDDRRNRSAAILARMLRHEITREQAVCLMHPGLVILGGLLLLLVVYALISA